MRGFCESCACEVTSVFDEYGADVCPVCEDDVHPGFAVEVDEEFTDEDFDEWLLNG